MGFRFIFLEVKWMTCTNVHTKVVLPRLLVTGGVTRRSQVKAGFTKETAIVGARIIFLLG